MIEKDYLDTLTQDIVNLRKQQFTTVNEVDYPIGDPWRRAYVNSINGRLTVQSEVVDPYKTAIFSAWGDTPTVTDD